MAEAKPSRRGGLTHAGWGLTSDPINYVYFVLVLACMSDVSTALTSPLPMVRQFMWVTAAIWAVLVLARLRGLSVPVVLQLGSLVAAIEVTVQCLFVGGLYSSVMSWLGVIVVVNYFVGGRLLGAFWFVVVLLLIFLQLHLHHQGDFGLLIGSQANQSSGALLDYSFICVSLIVVFLFFDQRHRNTMTELTARRSALENSQKELEHTLQMREHFIASVSHELRTPMNAILGLNAFLLSIVKDKPRATQVLTHTRQSADHLMTVINDVLDYSQFKSGQLRAQLATMPLRQVLQTAFDLFKPRINDSTVSYRLAIADDVPEWVTSDRHRLTQILVNLLGNAIKFTHQGEVSLQVQVIDEGVKFSVRDSGIGIPVDQQARLFERFNQADASIQRRFGGSGLGLTISQRLVQLLDGHMGFESTAGEGSVFWFWLPLRAVVSPAPSSTEPTQRLRSTAHGWHLLVVDDHPVNRLLLRQILQMTWPKASITEASNGETALQLLAQQPFDLVLMDMVMPGMDGIETTRALHVQLAQADKTVPPVLGLTANVNPHDLQRFQDAGLKGILLKPFERDALVAQIDALLLA